jgi:hypothetical protein
MRVRPGAPVTPAPMAGDTTRGTQPKKDRS